MRIRAIATRGAVLALSLSTFGVLPSSAATPSWNLTAGTAWLKAQVVDGHVEGDSGPDLSATVQTATALAHARDAGVKASKALTAMMAYLDGHVDAFVSGDAVPSPANDGAGALAQLIFLKQATGTANPADLVARLTATQQQSGLFGASDPTYDGTIRQSMAIVVLRRAGMGWADPVLVSARRWLQAQQCSNGGFSADAAATGLSGCDGDPASWLGPDSNSTAMAAWALSPANGAPTATARFTAAIGFLQRAERRHATWGWFPGLASDSNSSATVVLALAEAGYDVRSKSGTWSRAGESPVSGLKRFQVRPLDTPATAGGFRYQLSSSSPLPDRISTEEALLALAVAGG
jgi:hypothetical protein